MAEFKSPLAIRTIFVGGGTPSLLTPEQLARIFQTLSDRFNLSQLQETTIEANPGTIDIKKMAQYRELGFDRLSLGVQAFQNHLLKRLDRIHSAEQAVQAVAMARSADFTNINLDLIFGILGQTSSDWQESLTAALASQPEHLALYNLIYEEGTPLYADWAAGKIQPLAEETETGFYDFAWQYLASAGYQHYEISNYCRSGKECLHNQGYWDYRPYWGFGPAAHSFDGGRRAWNSPDLNGYLSALAAGKLPPAEQEILTAEMQLEEWLFLQMRQSKGVQLDQLLHKNCGQPIRWPEKLAERFGEPWQALFHYRGQRLSFTAKGMWLSDEILPILLTMLQAEGIVSPPADLFKH